MYSKKFSVIIAHFIIISLALIFIWKSIDTTSEFKILVYAMIIDIYTGIIKAIHEENLSITTSFKGMTRKASILAVVGLTFLIEKAINFAIPITTITTMFFIATEGLSIIENAASSGMPFPKRLHDILVNIKGENNG